MLIFLIGFMGSGKSFVGKKLAERINYNFVDLDTYIVENEQFTISEIFQQEGESVFRSKENAHLKSLFNLKNTIVATGGGTPCFFDNMDLMCKNGITIYLYTKNEILFSRLKNEREKRPLIVDTSDEELMNTIRIKIAERSAIYESAEAIFEVKSIDDSNVINEIYDFLTCLEEF